MTTLNLYNTRTRQVEAFKPLDPAHIRMYVCGPTVYDYAHIGNARPVVVFDVFYRLLKHLYPKVTYVRNITDVDDKINAAATASGQSIDTITKRTTAAFHEDMAALGALPPDIEPRATAYIPQMIEIIEKLIARGHAYAVEGHVLFAVTTFPAYGQFSGRDMEDMIAGARVEVAPYKKHPADFVLWKPSTPDLPGWESPWGRGRPGWHIECSAMSAAHLGQVFDIHGGGLDLVFPHHENEIAQSCAAHGIERMANVWMHNGWVTVEGEKMSKSLGNFITVRQLLGDVKGEVVRLALLQAHYRQPLDWTAAGVSQATAVLDKLYTALKQAEQHGWSRPTVVLTPPAEVLEALCDDLNIPKALAALHGYSTAVHKATNATERAAAAEALLGGGAMLGFLQQPTAAWFQGGDVDTAAIEALIAQRQAARAARDFATADKVRQQLQEMGIVLEDSAGGTTWRRA